MNLVWGEGELSVPKPINFVLEKGSLALAYVLSPMRGVHHWRIVIIRWRVWPIP
jgi:hypothetical protein